MKTTDKDQLNEDQIECINDLEFFSRKVSCKHLYLIIDGIDYLQKVREWRANNTRFNNSMLKALGLNVTEINIYMNNIENECLLVEKNIDCRDNNIHYELLKNIFNLKRWQVDFVLLTQ